MSLQEELALRLLEGCLLVWVPPDRIWLLQGRPVRRVRYNFDDDDQPLDKIAKLEQERAFGDEYGELQVLALSCICSKSEISA